jgi:hypothetical protein
VLVNVNERRRILRRYRERVHEFEAIAQSRKGRAAVIELRPPRSRLNR